MAAVFFTILILIVDAYFYQAVRKTIERKKLRFRKNMLRIYIGHTVFLLVGLWISVIMADNWPRNLMMAIVFVLLLSKVFSLPFLLGDDLGRFVRWTLRKVKSFVKSEKNTETFPGEPIKRSKFLMQAGLVAAAIPFSAMSFGIISGAYDYRIRRETLFLKNLPKEFDGLTLAQISDIHSGSFYNQTAVQGGVDMLLAEKPDLVFFTGDLVNNRATEIHDYFDIFKQVKAPLGVYSTLGNHDYGDYVEWPSAAAKAQNLLDVREAHKLLGWNLLSNENRIVTVDGAELAVVGVENWGSLGRFPKYGDVELAKKGTENVPVKLLLSHDPSHWDAIVNKEHKDMDVMFAGHTHGMQFGVEVLGIKWSPVQYFYKQWAGLYHQEQQALYVNRGYGFLGFPGRVGMPPEITIFTLKQHA